MKRFVCLLVAVVALAGGCGDDAKPRLTVFAASSLAEVLPAIDAGPRYSFGGSGELARQIRDGARADVYISADAKYATALYRAGLLERPRALAGNHVVVIVPRSNPASVSSLADLARPGVRIVIGEPGVPAGDLPRRVLSSSALGRRVLRNVVSEEHDVKAVVAKVALGEADAGFAYSTDVEAAREKVARLDAGALAVTVYAVAVARESDAKQDAKRFVDRLLSRRAQRLFLRKGFAGIGTAGKPLP